MNKNENLKKKKGKNNTQLPFYIDRETIFSAATEAICYHFVIYLLNTENLLFEIYLLAYSGWFW